MSSGAAPLTRTEMASLATRFWERGIELMENYEVDDLPLSERNKYLRELYAAEQDMGIEDGPYRAYRRYQRTCRQLLDDVTGERCEREMWADGPRCLVHAPVDQIDPNGAEERRRLAAKARTAAMTEKALDELERMLHADDDSVAPSLKFKALVEVLDRGGVPKRSESSVDVTAEVTHTTGAAESIRAKLERMHEDAVAEQLAELEAGLHSITESPEPAEAELVEPEEDRTQHE